jgi:protein-disulfide isomerase
MPHVQSMAESAGSLGYTRLKMKFHRLTAAALVAVVASATTFAQAPAPPQQTPPQTVQQQNEEILRELRAIRMLLERLTTPQQQAQAPPATARITNLAGYALGKADAPLTMVEFTDLQCPYCRHFVLTSFDELKKNWIDTGKLRYVTRDFPITDLHAQAMPAARAARCAGEQGKFWEMRIALMRNANLLSPAYISATAADLKLDAKAFAACAASTKFDAEIQSDMQEGTRLNVAGTPTFVLGRTSNGSIEGPVVVGALPYAQFDAKLRQLMELR